MRLQKRERQIADQLTAARRQAEQLQADGVTAADRLRQEADRPPSRPNRREP